ncbi:hypothetical protein EV361DRAFT_366639 [Lentinula raphanica]|nr:hypothetical protein EV361DRAFT_366639 [Lentinula raphanica]
MFFSLAQGVVSSFFSWTFLIRDETLSFALLNIYLSLLLISPIFSQETFPSFIEHTFELLFISYFLIIIFLTIVQPFAWTLDSPSSRSFMTLSRTFLHDLGLCLRGLLDSYHEHYGLPPNNLGQWTTTDYYPHGLRTVIPYILRVIPTYCFL